VLPVVVGPAVLNPDVVPVELVETAEPEEGSIPNPPLVLDPPTLVPPSEHPAAPRQPKTRRNALMRISVWA